MARKSSPKIGKAMAARTNGKEKGKEPICIGTPSWNGLAISVDEMRARSWGSRVMRYEAVGCTSVHQEEKSSKLVLEM